MIPCGTPSGGLLDRVRVCRRDGERWVNNGHNEAGVVGSSFRVIPCGVAKRAMCVVTEAAEGLVPVIEADLPELVSECGGADYHVEAEAGLCSAQKLIA